MVERLVLHGLLPPVFHTFLTPQALSLDGNIAPSTWVLAWRTIVDMDDVDDNQLKSLKRDLNKLCMGQVSQAPGRWSTTMPIKRCLCFPVQVPTCGAIVMLLMLAS